MKSSSFFHIIASSLILFAGCGGGSGNASIEGAEPQNGNRSTGTNPPVAAAGAEATSDTVKGGLAAAFSLPLVVAGNIYDSRSMVAEAVYFATTASGSALYGRAASTGTITVSPLGTRYDAAPADRLVVRSGDQTHEFVVKQTQGNSQASTAISWLQSPHILQYTHRIPEVAEAEITEQFDGQRFSVKTRGWAKINGQRFDVDLTAAGQTGGSRESDGQDTQTIYDMTGTISGNGCQIKVSQRQTLRTVSSYSLQLLTTQRGSATQINATLNNTLQCGSDTYVFNNVQVQSESTDKGGNSRSGVTAASGVILRGGQPFGTIALQNGAVFAVTGNEPIRLGGQ